MAPKRRIRARRAMVGAKSTRQLRRKSAEKTKMWRHHRPSPIQKSPTNFTRRPLKTNSGSLNLEKRTPILVRRRARSYPLVP